MKNPIIAASLALAALQLPAMDLSLGNLKVTADEIAADTRSESFTASGRVDVVARPYRLLSDAVIKDGDRTDFTDPTTVTTCTNELDHLHWSMTGEVVYKDGDYIIGRNQTLRMFGLPVLWLPYWYYPIDDVYGLRIMPGHASRWGAYLLSKYVYHLAGDPSGAPGTYGLKAATRVDLRSKNGVGAGQSLRWRLGDYGKGYIKGYYIQDHDLERYRRYSTNSKYWNYGNWESTVDRDRYVAEFGHRLEPTERDTVRIMAGVTSDSSFRKDFLRSSLFTLDNPYHTGASNELAWEHNENGWGMGISVAGRLNDFYAVTDRLPEYYIDINPKPVMDTGINYESQTRIGYLRRESQRNGSGAVSAFSYVPGYWANYGTFRLDSYHRLTYPMKFWDVLSAVPRLAYRGTYYGDSGYEHTETAYMGKAGSTGDGVLRSIFESGVTFSARGTAWIDDRWQSVVEPYFDVLAQEAAFSGLGSGKRIYVFDNLDASREWLDQFAGRSRNLPYSYYGVTPGVRKLFRQVDDRGNLRTVFDFDLYAAMQFGATRWHGTDKAHRLARNGKPNYGNDDFTAVPGMRMRWMPSETDMLGMWLEYDTDNHTLAMADVEWRSAVSKRASYFVRFSRRNYRWWDYASTPKRRNMLNENFNMVHFSTVTLGWEQELIADTIYASPVASWDFYDHGIAYVGGWLDYRTDCLGFRLMMSHVHEYKRLDGSYYKNDWNVSFLIYLTAMGADMADMFDL